MRMRRQGDPDLGGSYANTELNPQTLQLAQVINEVIGTAGQLAEQNKNRLVVDAQGNLGALTVDPCDCGRSCSTC